MTSAISAGKKEDQCCLIVSKHIVLIFFLRSNFPAQVRVTGAARVGRQEDGGMKRKRYDRVGLTDHCEQRALLPPGGATLVSLLDAPKAFIIDLLNKEKPGGKERRENIENMVAAGVRMHSHFAGKGTASTAPSSRRRPAGSC